MYSKISCFLKGALHLRRSIIAVVSYVSVLDARHLAWLAGAARSGGLDLSKAQGIPLGSRSGGYVDLPCSQADLDCCSD